MSTEDKIRGAFLRLLARLGDLEDDPDLVELYNEAQFGLKARAKLKSKEKDDYYRHDDLIVKTAGDYLSGDSFFMEPVLEFPIERSFAGGGDERGMADNHLAFDVYDLIAESDIEPPSVSHINDRVGDLGVRVRIIQRMYQRRKLLRPGRKGRVNYV